MSKHLIKEPFCLHLCLFTVLQTLFFSFCLIFFYHCAYIFKQQQQNAQHEQQQRKNHKSKKFKIRIREEVETLHYTLGNKSRNGCQLLPNVSRVPLQEYLIFSTLRKDMTSWSHWVLELLLTSNEGGNDVWRLGVFLRKTKDVPD